MSHPVTMLLSGSACSERSEVTFEPSLTPVKGGVLLGVSSLERGCDGCRGYSEEETVFPAAANEQSSCL